MATDNKYDRQIRLWGPQGQQRLMNANVLLIGADPSGVETLKNLVLPGIGQFTIIDDLMVTYKDLGNNFMVDEEHLNLPRAQIVTEFLLEMNIDVKGQYVHQELNQENLQKLIQDQNFHLIISNEQPQKLNEFLGLQCKTSKLIVIESSGLIGSMTILGGSHCILENKQEKWKQEDLRLDNPFSELIEYCDSFNLKELDLYEHQHVPYIVVLIKAMQLWKQENNNLPPQNFNEKQQFSARVKQMGKTIEQENIDEAFKFCFKFYMNQSKPNDNHDKLFEYFQNNEQNLQTEFWIFSRSLFLFYQKYERLPVTGVINDMVSSTENFTKLRLIYKNKANDDIQIMYDIMKTLPNSNQYTLEQMKKFCEKSQEIEWIQYKSLQDIYENPNEIPYVENDCHKWWFSLRGHQLFYKLNQRYPDEGDVQELLKIINDEIVSKYYKNFEPIEEKYAFEMCRYSNSKIHNISSFMGGIAAQEAVKLVTSQFQPINNVFIFNGIESIGCVFEL